MSDFPRGWIFTSDPGTGTRASVTVPAIAGVVHVIDSFSIVVVNAAGAAGNVNDVVALSSSDGTFAAQTLGRVFVIPDSSDSASGSGLDMAAGPGASLTITGPVANASMTETLIVQGHDI